MTDQNLKFMLFSTEKVKDHLHYEVKKYFKNFYDVNNISDEEIVNISKNIGIDIAVNLTGYTSESRNEIYLKELHQYK